VESYVIRKWPGIKNRQFRERLLSWYGRHKRMLPWRSRPTPYRVWIAEIMLQQTRVQTVLPYYTRFLKRFPDPAALAAASEEDVLAHWAGLGYYRRARNLRKAAIKIADQWRGRFPETLEDIGNLPGVGRYTAAAILSIAFKQPRAAVDGNVRRVIRRLYGIAKAPDDLFWELAESLLAKGRARDFNQAFMELGALVCLPSRPLCDICPVRSLCHSSRRGCVPASHARNRPAQVPVEMFLLVLECGGQIAIARQPDGGFIPGEWGLPGNTLRAAQQPLAAARCLARGILGRALQLELYAPVRHAITHRRILAHVCSASIEPPAPALADRHAWAPRTSLGRIFTSSLFRKALARIPAAGRRQLFRSSKTPLSR
jgi:A/G-specific adenine glycosylase